MHFNEFKTNLDKFSLIRLPPICFNGVGYALTLSYVVLRPFNFSSLSLFHFNFHEIVLELSVTSRHSIESSVIIRSKASLHDTISFQMIICKITISSCTETHYMLKIFKSPDWRDVFLVSQLVASFLSKMKFEPTTSVFATNCVPCNNQTRMWHEWILYCFIYMMWTSLYSVLNIWFA